MTQSQQGFERYQCPLSPFCSKEYDFPRGTATQLIEATLKGHIEEHKTEDFVRVITNLKSNVKVLTDLLTDVGQMFNNIERVRDRIVISNRRGD